MCMTYFSLSSILQTSFSAFSNFFISGKSGNYLWELNNCSRYPGSTSRKYHSFIVIFTKSSLKSDKYLLHHINPFTGNFWDIAYPYKLFASKYVRYDDSTFLS